MDQLILHGPSSGTTTCRGKGCKESTNILWHDERDDEWFCAHSWECAWSHVEFMRKMRDDRKK